MGQKILVTYATWAGSTREVAESMAKIIQKQGMEVEVHPAELAPDLDLFDAVIAGSGIHMGRVHTNLRKFVRKNATILKNMPVAWFAVCMTMKTDTAENREMTRGFLELLNRIAPGVTTRATGCFAGAIQTKLKDYHELPFFIRWMIRKMGKKDGDYRNWEIIEQWTLKTARILLSEN